MWTKDNPPFTTPNLDGMDAFELVMIAQVFTILAQYATVKATAMRQRANGEIKMASIGERLLDLAAMSLPEWARW